MIVLFAGAGASRAVSEKYPTTAEFLDRVPKAISSEQLYQFAIEHLQRTAGKRQLDIELVLGFFATAIEQLRTISRPDTPLGFLLEGNRVSNLVSPSVDFRNTIGFAHEMAQRISRVRDEINALVFRVYSELPTASELSNNWLPLLKALKTSSVRVEIFTTNYDPVIDQAIVESGINIDRGREGTVYPVLNLPLWRGRRDISTGLLELVEARGLLTKLHGDVCWSRDGDRIYAGTPTFRGSHDPHVIIYPGIKDEPMSEPFSTFHDHFREVLRSAAAIVFIGFAFRDPAVNRILETRLVTGTRVLVVNPGLSETDLPPALLTRTTVMKKSFDKDAAREIMEALQLD